MALLAVQYSSAVYTQRCEVSSNTSSSKTWNAKTDFACVHAQLLSHVQLFETPWTAAFQVHGIFQSRILEQVAISFFRDSSQPRDRAHVSYTGRQILSRLLPGRPPRLTLYNFKKYLADSATDAVFLMLYRMSKPFHLRCIMADRLLHAVFGHKYLCLPF